MGNEAPQSKNPQVKVLEVPRLDIACLKVKAYLELHRDRRINQALQKEKSLSQQINSASRVRVDEYQKLSSLVIDVNFIEACNLVIRCIDVIKGQSLRVCQSGGDQNRILDLMPYIETLLWSSNHLNLSSVQEFKNLMILFFGPSLYDVNKLQSVDPELRALFASPVPDALMVNDFAIKFAEKYGVQLDQLNAPGHMFSPTFQLPNQQLPQQQYQPNPQQFAPPVVGGFTVNIQVDPYQQQQQYNVQVPQQPYSYNGQPQGGPQGNSIPQGQGNNPYGNVQGYQAQAPMQPFTLPPSQQGGYQPLSNQQSYHQPSQQSFQPPQQPFTLPAQQQLPSQPSPYAQLPSQPSPSFQPPQQPHQYPQGGQSIPQQSQAYQQPPPFQPMPFPNQPQPNNYQQPQPNNYQQPQQPQGQVGNPMAGDDDLDELEARFNRLKGGL